MGAPSIKGFVTSAGQSLYDFYSLENIPDFLKNLPVAKVGQLLCVNTVDAEGKILSISVINSQSNSGEAGKDGLSIYPASVIAGETTEIDVERSLVASSERGVNVGDLLLTEDGKIFKIVSFTEEGSSDSDEIYEGYLSEFVVDLNGPSGTSPTVTVSTITNGNRITIIDVNGTKTIDVLNGSNGKDGTDGNGIKSAVLNSDYTLTLTFDDGTSYTTPSIRGETGEQGETGPQGLQGEKGETGEQGPAGANGANGADGVSPTITENSSNSSTVYKLDITDKDGTRTTPNLVGKTGATGVGIASVEQTTTSTTDDGENVITVTMTDGSKYQFTVKNGSRGYTSLPYGGSKEWLEANGDKSQLYQIDGYVWGYVESDGWTKSGIQYLVVSSESEMTNEGGTEYLLRSGNEGTVYAYTEASGDADVPVYDSLPETADEGDIVAVGVRKYKASLATTQVPDYTNLATTFETGRLNSSGAVTTTNATGAVTCTDYISVTAGDIVRVKGYGALDDYFVANYNASKGITSASKPATSASGYTYAYDEATGIATLTITDDRLKYMRISGSPTGTTDDIIITVNEKIAIKTETAISWTDIGEYVAPVEAGWNATDETYSVIDSLSTTANSGDSSVYSGDGYVYTYIAGADWMATSKYVPSNLSIDEELSDSSTNAVQNKVVKAAIDEVNNKAITNANDIITLQNEVEALGVGASSDAVTIPSYWETMVEEKTNTVKALQEAGGKDCVCFAWCADTHIPDCETDSSVGMGRVNDLGKVMAKMLDNCEIPFAMLSGDINTRASYGTEEEFLTKLEKVPEFLAPLWDTDRLLMCLGNHDGVWGNITNETNGTTYYYQYRFPQGRMWQTFFRGQALDFRRVFSDDGLYFYMDNIPQKTRFIVLNSHFSREEALANEELRAVKNNTSCYGQTQLEWLANVALDMPDGYSAVITAHIPPKPVNGATTPATVDCDLLVGIINAYCGKTTFSGSHTGTASWAYDSEDPTVNVDFTSAKGEIIAMFAGHIHWDTIDTTTLACPLITIIASGAPVNTVNLAEGEVAPTRTFGTDTETSFDVVTINKKTRTIHCTRVGAGNDREVEY